MTDLRNLNVERTKIKIEAGGEEFNFYIDGKLVWDGETVPEEDDLVWLLQQLGHEVEVVDLTEYTE